MMRNLPAGLWIVVAFVLGCGDGPREQEAQQPSREAPVVNPAPAPAIHRSGSGSVAFLGVHIPPAEPNVDGPYVFGKLDLDNGREDSGSGADLGLVVDARVYSITFQEAHAAAVGPTQPDYERCRELLSAHSGQVSLGPFQPPTGWVCVQTGEGRISVVRVMEVRQRQLQAPAPPGSNIYDLELVFEFSTWEIPTG